MPRTKKQNEEIKEATVAKIRKAGLKLFATKGLTATSIVDISEKAGISTGLMYHYYKSKEDLYAELVVMTIDEANSAVLEISRNTLSPGQKIKRLAEQMHAGIKDDESAVYFYVFMSQVLLSKHTFPSIKKQMKGTYLAYEQVSDIIAAGQQTGEIKAGDPVTLSSLFFSTITGLCIYKLIMGKKFRLPSSDMLTSILLKE